MTNNERVELELYVDILNSLIADFYHISSEHNMPLNRDDNVGTYYRRMIQYVNHLRRATSYEDVLAARKNIAAIKEKLIRLEVFHDI